MNTTPEGNKPITIFYSYAQEDRSLRDRLVKHLSLLKRQGHISDWSDQNVKPGQEKRKEINKNLLSADIILLLVSANFLATNYCETSEVEMAMRRHDAGEAWVIPILVCNIQRIKPMKKISEKRRCCCQSKAYVALTKRRKEISIKR